MTDATLIKIDPEIMEGKKEIPLNGKQLQDQPPNEFFEKFLKSQLDQTFEYPEPESIINLVQGSQEIRLLTKKAVSLWHAKHKARKTTALAILCAAFIADTGMDYSEGGTYLKAIEKGKVIFFDTEQGSGYGARTMRLILKMANLETSENLIYCDLRAFTPKERVEIIIAAIQSTSGLKLVVIDGVIDLINDWMQPEEGHALVTRLLRACSAYDIHIAFVLHQNKADKNPRYAIGTMCAQKCELEIGLELDSADKNQSIISCVSSRGLSFEPFYIRWEQGHLPRIVSDSTVITQSDDGQISKKIIAHQIPMEKHLEILGEIFQSVPEPYYKDLITNIKLSFQKYGVAFGENKAGEILTFWKNKGWIKSEKQPLKRFPVYLPVLPL